MQMSISERFPALHPLALRRERAREVFLLIARYNRYSKKPENSRGKQSDVIRKPAGDDWF
jgi:hypothetical protein